MNRTGLLLSFAAALAICPLPPGGRLLAQEEDPPAVLIPAPVMRREPGLVAYRAAPELRSLAFDADGDEDDSLEPVSLADGLTDLLEPEVRRRGGTIDDEDRSVSVTGDASTVDWVRERTAEVARFARGTCTVSVALVRLSEPGAPDTDEVRRAVREQRAAVEWPLTLECDRGDVVRREELATRNFVSSIELEVAMEASVASPQGLQLVTGRRLELSCRATSPETALAEIALHVSTRVEPVRREEVRAGSIDLPEAPFVGLFAPLALVTGRTETLIVPGPGGRGQLALLVTLDRVDVPREPAFALIDLAAYAGRSDTLGAARRVGLRGDPVSEDADSQPDGEEDDEVAHARREALWARLTASGAELVALSETLLAVARQGPATPRLLDELRNGGAGTELVRTRRTRSWEELCKLEAFDPLRGAVADDADAPETLLGGEARFAGLRLPVRRGTPTLFACGTWFRTIAAYSGEVAQSAGMTYPEPSGYVAGEMLRLRIDEGAVDVRSQRLDIEERRTESLASVEDIGQGPATTRPDRLEVVTGLRVAENFRLSAGAHLRVRRMAVTEMAEIDHWRVR